MAMKEGLSDESKTRIQRNYQLLLSDLDLAEVIDPFISEGYFEIGIEEIIKAEAQYPTPKEKNRVFIKKLLQCSDSAYDLLRKTLIEKGFHHIVDDLDKTDVSKVSQVIQQKAKPRDRVKELSETLFNLTLDDRSVIKFNLVIAKDMEILGKEMGFVQSEMDHIKMETTYSVATQMSKLFTKWRHRYGQAATVGLLLDTLQNAEISGAEVDWDQYDKGLELVKKMNNVR